MATATAKREFTQADVEYSIRKAAEHCAWLLSHHYEGTNWTTEDVISHLSRGGKCLFPQLNNSFSERGFVTSLSYRMENLQEAIYGRPSRSWLHYWTKR